MGLRKVFGSGMPGVGVVPFGTAFAAPGAGIPGVVLAEGAIGLADNPGGMLFALTSIATLLFALILVLGVVVEHAAPTVAPATITQIKYLEFIIKTSSI